jgi:hypothetical protein
MANAKTEQIILRILWAGNSENQLLVRSSGLPPLYSGTLPPPRNPKGQPIRSEKQGWADCLASAVLSFGVQIQVSVLSGP